MRLKIYASLLVAATAALTASLTACSQDSSSGRGPGGLVAQDNLKDEKPIGEQEFRQEMSSWLGAGCGAGFAPGLNGQVFRREESFITPWLVYMTQTTERVTSAFPDQVVTERIYDVTNVIGLSGGIYVGNRSQRLCRFSSSAGSSSMNCEENGTMTPEAQDFARNLPKNPEEDCKVISSSPDGKVEYFSGLYVFEDGTQIPVLKVHEKWINETECSGRHEQRRVESVEVQTNKVKAYPGDGLCGTRIYDHIVMTDMNGRNILNHKVRALSSPRK